MLIAQLGMRIDSDDVSGAADDLDKFTAAGGRAQKAADQLTTSAGKTSGALSKQRDELADLLGEIDPTVKALGRLDELEKRLAQQRKLGSLDAATFSDYQGKIAQSRESLTRFDDSLTRVGNTAKQTAAAMRNVPAQFTDIVVSLQAGQNPLQVFLQQGGQLKDMFGGIGPAASALGGYVMGLVNPFTVAAAGAATLAYGFEAGRQEAVEYNKALILTGGYAGVTAGQLSTMAGQVSSVVGTTGAAASALATLAGGGKIASDSFVQVTQAAIAMEQATGKAVGDTIAEFNKIADDPVAAAKALDDQYHFLTASVYSQIVALKDQGDTIGATRLLTDNYADTVRQRAGEITQNLGLIERGWKAIKTAAGGALDALKEVGREKTLDQQIAVLRKSISEAEKSGSKSYLDQALGQGAYVPPSVLKSQKDLLGYLEMQQGAEAQKAKFLSDQQVLQGKATTAMQAVDKLTLSSRTNEEKRTDALDAYRKQLDDIRKIDPNDARLSAAAIAKNEQAIRDQFKDPATRTRRSAVDLTDLNDEQNARKALVSSYANSQKELEAQQKAGLITQEAYYRQRVVLITAEKEQVAAAYQGEIDALEQAKARSTTSAEQRIQLDQKIADARANMVKAQKDADSELSVLALNEQGRLKRQEESVRTYTDALQQQVRTLRDQGQRSAATLGMGDRQRSLYDSQNAITDRINSSRLELANQYGDGSRGMSIEEYQSKLEALKATENDLRATVVSNYDDMTTAQGDWRNGASSAWQNYLEDAQNVAGQAKTAFTSLYDGMTDAVVEWAAGSDQKFGDVAASFAKMIAKMALQASVSSVWTSIFGAAVTVGGGAAAGATTSSGFTYGLGSASAGLTYGGGRAVGGQVSGGSFYQVNEKGPELLSQGGKSYLMMGSDGGSITPLTSGASAASAAGGTARAVEVTVIVNSDGSVETKTNEQSWKSMGDEIGRFVDARIRENEARSLSSQGNIRRAINGRA